MYGPKFCSVSVAIYRSSENDADGEREGYIAKKVQLNQKAPNPVVASLCLKPIFLSLFVVLAFWVLVLFVCLFGILSKSLWAIAAS